VTQVVGIAASAPRRSRRSSSRGGCFASVGIRVSARRGTRRPRHQRARHRGVRGVRSKCPRSRSPRPSPWAIVSILQNCRSMGMNSHTIVGHVRQARRSRASHGCRTGVRPSVGPDSYIRVAGEPSVRHFCPSMAFRFPGARAPARPPNTFSLNGLFDRRGRRACTGARLAPPDRVRRARIDSTVHAPGTKQP